MRGALRSRMQCSANISLQWAHACQWKQIAQVFSGRTHGCSIDDSAFQSATDGDVASHKLLFSSCWQPGQEVICSQRTCQEAVDYRLLCRQDCHLGPQREAISWSPSPAISVVPFTTAGGRFE